MAVDELMAGTVAAGPAAGPEAKGAPPDGGGGGGGGAVVSSREDAMLWLWRTHNKVGVRVLVVNVQLLCGMWLRLWLWRSVCLFLSLALSLSAHTSPIHT
jgi:hypothetical protein